MELAKEDISKILVSDIPTVGEYSSIIYEAQDTGKLLDTDFRESQQHNNKSWADLYLVVARCIARGMRIQKEQPRI